MTDVVEIVVAGPPAIVEIVGVGAVEVVEVSIPGPQGALCTGASYVHTQGSPATTWTINHNLGFRPAVAVLSVGSMEVEAEVTHTSVNQVVIGFVTATAGSARLV